MSADIGIGSLEKKKLNSDLIEKKTHTDNDLNDGSCFICNLILLSVIFSLYMSFCLFVCC